jgi:hypothetical protein
VIGRPSWKHQTSLCRALVASVLLAGGLHAQAQPAGSGLTVPVRMEAIRQRIDGALADHAYNGLDPLEKRTIAYLAVNAVMIIETGQCAEAGAAGTAAEGFLFTFGSFGRKGLQRIFELPAARKTDLVDKAMELASQQTPDAGLTHSICDGRLLPASSIKPIAERREEARQVLLLGLSPPTSNTLTQPPPPGERSEPPSPQSNSTPPPAPE